MDTRLVLESGDPACVRSFTVVMHTILNVSLTYRTTDQQLTHEKESQRAPLRSWGCRAEKRSKQTICSAVSRTFIVFSVACPWWPGRLWRPGQMFVLPPLLARGPCWFTDYLYLGLFVPWTIRTLLDCSYHGRFVPCWELKTINPGPEDTPL